jgi:branched-chain amino acid transport system ATP-binding protein
VSPRGHEMLRVESVDAGYGDTQVLWSVKLEVRPGDVVALVGSNGAGKSTLLAAISGLVRCRAGRITFGSAKLHEMSADAIVKAGVAHVPQGRRLFGSMTVRENLLMGAYLRKNKAEIADDLEDVLATFPRLRERYNFLAGRLSGGEQQMVAVGRALMSRPQLLMIDEMSLGLAPVMVDSLLEAMQHVHRRGVSILMVEQDIQAALEFASQGYVLETGRVTLFGSAAQLLDDPRVQKAYLGV